MFDKVRTWWLEALRHLAEKGCSPLQKAAIDAHGRMKRGAEAVISYLRLLELQNSIEDPEEKREQSTIISFGVQNVLEVQNAFA
jgi:glutamate mutase epsilon subunit